MNKNFKTIKELVKYLFVLGVFGFAFQSFAVWTVPSTTPTGGNTNPPFNKGVAPQQKTGALIVQGGFRSMGQVVFDNTLFIPISGAGLGKVLTSDAQGNASWITPTGGSTGWTFTTGTPNTVAMTNPNLGDNLVLGTNTTVYKGSVAPGNRFIHNTGTDNFFAGMGAGNLSVTGIRNTGIGTNSLLNTSSGTNNTAVGFNALSTNTTGSNNTAIGSNANVSASNLNNATAIGYGAVVNASDKVRIGNSSLYFGESVTVIEGNVAYSWPSDLRLKKNIKDTDLGLDFVKKLRPVSFNTKTGDSNTNYGFIAQEVEALIGHKTNIVLTDNSPEQMKTMRYTDLIAPLTRAVQEQQEIIEDYKEKINIYTKKVEELEKQKLNKTKNE